jgi:hypothetical protein
VKFYRAGKTAGPQGHRNAGGPDDPNQLHFWPIFSILTRKYNKNPGRFAPILFGRAAVTWVGF